MLKILWYFSVSFRPCAQIFNNMSLKQVLRVTYRTTSWCECSYQYSCHLPVSMLLYMYTPAICQYFLPGHLSVLIPVLLSTACQCSCCIGLLSPACHDFKSFSYNLPVPLGSRPCCFPSCSLLVLFCVCFCFCSLSCPFLLFTFPVCQFPSSFLFCFFYPLVFNWPKKRMPHGGQGMKRWECNCVCGASLLCIFTVSPMINHLPGNWKRQRRPVQRRNS